MIVLDYGDSRSVIGPYPATPAGRALLDQHFDALVEQVADDNRTTDHVVVTRVELTPVRDWDVTL